MKHVSLRAGSGLGGHGPWFWLLDFTLDCHPNTVSRSRMQWLQYVWNNQVLFFLLDVHKVSDQFSALLGVFQEVTWDLSFAPLAPTVFSTLDNTGPEWPRVSNTGPQWRTLVCSGLQLTRLAYSGLQWPTVAPVALTYSFLPTAPASSHRPPTLRQTASNVSFGLFFWPLFSLIWLHGGQNSL